MNETRNSNTWRKWTLLMIASAGLILGGFCGVKVEGYRLDLAWDKITLNEAKGFLEWYIRLSKGMPIGTNPNIVFYQDCIPEKGNERKQIRLKSPLPSPQASVVSRESSQAKPMEGESNRGDDN